MQMSSFYPGIWVSEGVLFLFAAASAVFIFQSRRMFEKDETHVEEKQEV